jgi:hypothetical protein
MLVGAGGSHVLVRGRESAVTNFHGLATLGDYLEGFEAGADLPYLTNLCVYTNFPEMRDQLNTPAYFEPNWKTRWPLSALSWTRDNPIGSELFLAPGGLTSYECKLPPNTERGDACGVAQESLRRQHCRHSASRSRGAFRESRALQNP